MFRCRGERKEKRKDRIGKKNKGRKVREEERGTVKGKAGGEEQTTVFISRDRTCGKKERQE